MLHEKSMTCLIYPTFSGTIFNSKVILEPLITPSMQETRPTVEGLQRVAMVISIGAHDQKYLLQAAAFLRMMDMTARKITH